MSFVLKLFFQHEENSAGIFSSLAILQWVKESFLEKMTLNLKLQWSSNPTPGHISGENSNSKRYMHPSVHSSTIYNSQNMEAT